MGYFLDTFIAHEPHIIQIYTGHDLGIMDATVESGI